MNKYKVIDTPMRPGRWKVESIDYPGGNNSWTEYFKDEVDAIKECDRRNAPFTLINPEWGYDDALFRAMRLHPGELWQRTGELTQGDCLPTIAQGLLEVLALQGLPAELPFQKKSLKREFDDEMLKAAVKALCDEFPDYVNSTEVMPPGLKERLSASRAWPFNVRYKADIIILAQNRTSFMKNEPKLTYPPQKDVDPGDFPWDEKETAEEAYKATTGETT